MSKLSEVKRRFYRSHIWARYCAVRLFYVSGRAEGVGRGYLIMFAVFEFCRPSPRVRIEITGEFKRPGR